MSNNNHEHHHEHHHEHCECSHHTTHSCCSGEDSGCCHHNENRRSLYIRFAVGAAAVVAILLLPIPSYFLLIPYLILGYDVLVQSFKNIFKGNFFDEEFLMSVATLGAILLGEYTEACAVMFFYQIGELIGDITSDKCRSSIKNMFDFAPDSARRITDSGFETVTPDQLKPGDKISVFAGEKIPCDGIIYSGNSYLDTSSLTGESMPVYVTDGSKVLGGSINTDSPINIRVTSEYKDSSVAKVVRMLEEASKNKSHSEKFITSFAKKYTPTVVIIALLCAIILPFFPNFTIKSGIYTALIFLVVSCPCALVISIPLTLFAGIGNASKNKILFKSNKSLEALYKIKNFAFDKTGTLTTGNFSISEKCMSGEDFSLLADIERYSRHPLAGVISKFSSVPFKEAKEITEIKGMGITALIDSKKVIAGNSKLLAANKIKNIPDLSGTVIYLAVDGEYKGYVRLTDNLKDEAQDVISNLKQSGATIAVVSGDSEEAVKATADKLGISDYYSELLPENKAEIVKQLKSKNPLAYIGDGINDAPVLTISDIGISMGGAGSDIAIANSDIILLNDNLKKLEKALKISKKTMHIVYQNIVFSIGIKIIVMILGILGISSMPLAIFADVGVMILAILNSIRAIKL